MELISKTINPNSRKLGFFLNCRFLKIVLKSFFYLKWQNSGWGHFIGVETGTRKGFKKRLGEAEQRRWIGRLLQKCHRKVREQLSAGQERQDSGLYMYAVQRFHRYDLRFTRVQKGRLFRYPHQRPDPKTFSEEWYSVRFYSIQRYLSHQYLPEAGLWMGPTGQHDLDTVHAKCPPETAAEGGVRVLPSWRRLSRKSRHFVKKPARCSFSKYMTREFLFSSPKLLWTKTAYQIFVLRILLCWMLWIIYLFIVFISLFEMNKLFFMEIQIICYFIKSNCKKNGC